MATSALRVALDHLRRGDDAAARDALIEAWRARRSPRVAELVELLDGRAPDPLSARLAAIVTARVATSTVALKKLARIDDPRLAGWVIDALARPPFTAATAQPFIAALLATAGRLRDPRLAARAPDIRTALRTRIARAPVRDALLSQLERVLARLAYEEAGPAERAVVDQLASRLDGLRAPRRSASALLADVYAHPDDDAPRSVYADALLEQGDRRGEFIQLQLQRGRAGEASARELALQKQHGKAWLGTLAPVLSFGRGYSGTRFVRGFVGVADIILSVGKKLAPVMTDPAWATVEALHGVSFGVDLLASAPLRALRSFEPGIGSDDVLRLARRGEPLRVTEVLLHAMPEVPVELDALHRAFPALVRASLYLQPTERVLATLAGFGIRDLTLDAYLVGDTPVADATRSFEQVVAAIRERPAAFERLQLVPPGPGPGRVPITLVRDRTGRYRAGTFAPWYGRRPST